MNEQEKKGYDFVWGAILAIGELYLIGIILFCLMNLVGYGTDSTDFSAWKRSGMSLHTDAKTGLQYLYKNGSLIPRLDVKGNHMQVNR